MVFEDNGPMRNLAENVFCILFICIIQHAFCLRENRERINCFNSLQSAGSTVHNGKTSLLQTCVIKSLHYRCFCPFSTLYMCIRVGFSGLLLVLLTVLNTKNKEQTARYVYEIRPVLNFFDHMVLSRCL